MSGLRSVLVLLQFHLVAGVRVALRSSVPVVTLSVVLVVFTESASAILLILGTLFYPPGISPAAAMVATLVGVACARWASRWITTGLWGWIRHLPVSGAAHRRGATAGLVVAQAPVLVVLVAAGLATIGSDPATTIPRLVGGPLLAWSAAHAALRGTALSGRILAFLAGSAAFSGAWWLLGVGVALVVAADALAGRIEPPPSRTVARRPSASVQRRSGVLNYSTAVWAWTVISLRALRWRTVSIWWIAPVTLVPLVLFLNNDLTPGQEALAVRLAGLIAVVMMMASLADSLAHKRPAWPWSRSLPWSAQTRVALDAAILLTVATPVLAATMVLFKSAVPPIGVTVLFLAARGAAAIRQPFRTLNAPSAHMMFEGFLAAGLVALVPAAAVVLAVLVPFALRWGAKAEREVKIGQWQELGPSVAGDSQAWTNS